MVYRTLSRNASVLGQSLIATQYRKTRFIIAEGPGLHFYLVIMSDDPHKPVVIDAQDLMGPGPVLLLRGEMAIKEDLPLIEAHKPPDPPLSIRLVFLCIEVSIADGKGIEDLLQDGIKETSVHVVFFHQKNRKGISYTWQVSQKLFYHRYPLGSIGQMSSGRLALRP
jgi:hypothetical protein